MKRLSMSFACLLFTVIAWSGGVQPAAAEDEGRHRIRGEVLKIDGNRVWIKAQEGQQVEVDVSKLSAEARRSLNPGDQVVVVGDVTGGDPQKPSTFAARGLRGKDVVGDRVGRDQADDGRNRIRGEVLKVDGNRMWIKAREGQQVEVDISRLAADSRRSLNRGDEVVVLGDVTGGDPQKPNKFEARGIRGPDVVDDRVSGARDRNDRNGREELIGPLAAVDSGLAWVMVGGQQVPVDISNLSNAEQRSLRAGGEYVFIGERRNNRFVAQEVRNR